MEGGGDVADRALTGRGAAAAVLRLMGEGPSRFGPLLPLQLRFRREGALTAERSPTEPAPQSRDRRAWNGWMLGAFTTKLRRR